MTRCLSLWLIGLLFVSGAVADESFPRVPPTPADRAEATFEVLHGFRMELIAAEPLVASPVDLAYDEDGRAYVVEMRDYPFPEEKNAQPTEFPGTVSLLEDTDGDGRFDRSTIFADQLAWPTSVACWRGGVFVAAAPDIWYFKDTDGNRQADIRRKVFTGFGRYNVQAIMNNLRWGLDNKLYGAAAGNGGSIRHAQRPDEPAISLARRDFRFDPLTEKLEAISGGERFGNTFDDWGNRFVCNIRNPVQHVVLEQRDLARNPHLVVPRVIHDCAESGDQLQVFRLSPPEPWRVFRAQRWALEGATMPRSELIGAGYWTSSSGVTVYRGGAYPPEFRGNVFIGEVAGNLVHRQLLTRDGVTFKSTRADENTEFIRSRDNWFRPVNFVNAPDGTLHVLDMYRETIEHPWSIPDDIKAQLDLSSGKERGRIYRLAPPNFASSPPPRLSAATTNELVAHLESPQSWYRETAQRLLVERKERAAIPDLHRLIRKSRHPLARLHALYALQALGDLTVEDIFIAPGANQPEIYRHAVVLSESFSKDSPELRQLLHSGATHRPFVQLQVAVSMGNAPRELALEVLTEAAQYRAGDPWIRTAIVSSALPIAGELAEAIHQSVGNAANRGALMRELAITVGAQGDRAVIERLLIAIPERATLAGLGQGLARRNEKLSDHLPHLPAPLRDQLDRQISYATRLATDSRAQAFARIEAIHLLAFLAWDDARGPLLTDMDPSQPREVQQAALSALASFVRPEAAAELIARWKQLTPPLREEAVNVLLSRAIWHESLVAAIEKGEIPLSQLSIPQRARLAAVKDTKLLPRIQEVLGKFAFGPRKEVLDKYQASLALAAEAMRGAAIYRRECANCHKLGGEGHEVGPNLATIQHRSPQEILIHVLDPNREVSPHFLDYSVRLSDGRVLTGLIASESDGGLVLRRAEGREDAVARSDIDEITSSGKSLMPEGLEQKINEQEMADLIGFLRTSPAPSPRPSASGRRGQP